MISNFLSSNTKRLFKYSKKYQKKVCNIFAFFLSIEILLLIQPFVLRYLIDDVMMQSNFSLLLPLIVIYLLLVIGHITLNFFGNYYIMSYGADVIKNEQLILYEKLQKAPPIFLNFKIGDILARLTSDLEYISNFLLMTKPSIIINIIQFGRVSLILFIFSWPLALLTYATIPIYFWILKHFKTKLMETSKEERKGYSKVMESLREKIENLNTIKLYKKEEFFQQKLKGEIEEWSENKKQYVWNEVSLNRGLIFISAIMTPIILGFGGYMVMKDILTLGTLIAFLGVSQGLYGPLNLISGQLATLQRADTLSQRFFEILDLPEEESDGILPFPKDYDIKYNNVSFTYKDELVLKDINLYIDKNEKIAIVGTSGSGKSTMMNLLVRLYDPTSGEILLEDKNLKEYNLQEIREHIKLVRGNDPLFNMSVKENIMLGDEFSDQEFNKAVKKAKVDKFINLLDEGYDTIVGERGSKLSDGQRQRVAIARALIREPKVLILDEATSGVDSQTEEEIFEELKEYDMTLIIISHRLSTIRKADKVVVLKDGEIIGEGTHNELIESSPVYKEIIESQLVV
ncbi:MAG TPA: ABC transporter ATP-binding protein [Defluviitoga sp.]|nr:ABC transporter ATP-binding protein [Defluviitoga sp.]HPU60230.1 ABC transporter ATP-binding protein [Defluviitoga tunisiensis]